MVKHQDTRCNDDFDNQPLPSQHSSSTRDFPWHLSQLSRTFNSLIFFLVLSFSSRDAFSSSFLFANVVRKDKDAKGNSSNRYRYADYCQNN